jgi:hypothetical protein
MNQDTNSEFDVASQYASIFEGQNKKISCPHELVFNITAHLMKENEHGKDMSCEQVCGKNFHIPVKDGADPTMFMNTFFKFLENCLAESAKFSYTQSESKENNNV